jgi:uncharacterized membrane protein (Fun14 family)
MDFTVSLWILIILLYVALCYVVGRLAIDLLDQAPAPVIVAGAVLVGAALLGLQLWLYGVVRIPWNQLTLLVPWLAIGAVRRDRLLVLVRQERQRVAALTRVLPRLTGLEGVLVVAGTIVVLAYLLSLVAKPLFGFDAIALWLFKAKLYYGQQAVSLQAVSQDVGRNLDYPPLLSLMVASFYTLIGQANDLLGKAVTFIFVLVGSAASLTALSRWLSRPLAITFTFVLVAMPMFAPALLTGPYFGYADYPLGVCMMLSLLYFFEGQTTRHPTAYLFTVVFAALAALLKNEGLPFLAIVLVLLGIHLAVTGQLRNPERRHWPILTVGLLAIVPVIAWRLYVSLAGLAISPQVSLAQDISQLPARASTIVRFVLGLPRITTIGSVDGDRPISYVDILWLGLSFLLSGLLLAANRFRAGTLIYAAIALQAAGYFLVLLFTPLDLLFQLSTAASRLLIQLAPSVVLMLGIALSPFGAERSQGGPGRNSLVTDRAPAPAATP